MGSIFNVQQVINGLQTGSIYALIALGYTMVYGIVRLINFAHGDFFMIGAYASYGSFFLFNSLLGAKGGTLAFIVLIFSVLAGGAVAAVTNRFAYRPLRYKPKLSSLITAIGVSMFIEYFFSAFPPIGPSYKAFPEILPKMQIAIGSATISNYTLIDIGVAAVLMIGLTVLVKWTPLGKAMRAVSQDKDAAKLMGIDVERVISWTFIIGGAFAGVAGLLNGMTYPRIFPYMGIQPGLKAFIAAVLGGIGNIPGAVIGAYIMGLAETFASAYNSLLGEGIAFAILILVLLVRPRGILGEKTADKI
ncbi:MAG: branched-chain amino acid ABC transporter permease [Spirochaetes bacterium]|nr:branched-chain amino acid ABC transporter permease [Spirochaetota bacterium]